MAKASPFPFVPHTEKPWHTEEDPDGSAQNPSHSRDLLSNFPTTLLFQARNIFFQKKIVSAIKTILKKALYYSWGCRRKQRTVLCLVKNCRHFVACTNLPGSCHYLCIISLVHHCILLPQKSSSTGATRILQCLQEGTYVFSLLHPLSLYITTLFLNFFTI